MEEMTIETKEKLKQLSKEKGYKVTYAYWHDKGMRCSCCHDDIVMSGKTHFCRTCEAIVVFS